MRMMIKIINNNEKDSDNDNENDNDVDNSYDNYFILELRWVQARTVDVFISSKYIYPNSFQLIMQDDN